MCLYIVALTMKATCGELTSRALTFQDHCALGREFVLQPFSVYTALAG